MAPVNFIANRLGQNSAEKQKQEEERKRKAQEAVNKLNAEREKNCSKDPKTGCTFTPWTVAAEEDRWWR
jgi:hypothetical protein